MMSPRAVSESNQNRPMMSFLPDTAKARPARRNHPGPHTAPAPFSRGIRAVARLARPRVVGALDVGETPSPDGHSLTLHYFVMEFVPGQDLDQLVKNQGRLSVVEACDIVHQVASALAEAHKH